MAARWKLVQAFLREFTEGADFVPLTDKAVVYARIRAVQQGRFNAVTADGLTQVSSRIGDTEFNFALNGEMSPEGIVAIAEDALQIVDAAADVTEIRRLLKRRRSTVADFSQMGQP